MPSTLPATAPISRRRLSARTRSSKTITAPAAPAPMAALTHPVQAEGVKEITDPSQQGHKQNSKKNEIHKKLTPPALEKKGSSPGTSREYADFPAESSRAD